MKRSGSRILTTHVGSLIRPPELIELGREVRQSLSRRSPGGAAADRYHGALARATEDVVRRQVDAAKADIVAGRMTA